VNNDGNVGIGTTNPTSFTGFMGGSAIATTINANNGAVLNLQRGTDINNSGIGALQFVNTNNSADAGMGSGSQLLGLISIANVTSNGNTGSDAGGNLRLYTKQEAGSCLERMRITSDGNVGIGTTNPRGKLEIGESSEDAFYVDFQSGEGITNFKSPYSGVNGNRGGWQFITKDGGTTPYNALRINSVGNVGIGITNPLSKLTVNPGSVTNAGTWSDSALAITNQTNIGSYSQISFGYTTGTTNAAAYLGFVSTNQGSNGYGDLVFGTRSVNTDTAPTERMRINSDGNVGIGTANPGAYRLDVTASQTEFVQKISNSHSSSAYGLYVQFDGNHDDTTSEYIRCSTNGNGNINFKVYSDGTMLSDGASVGSDDRIKHNEEKIVNAVDTLSKITPKKYFKTTKLYDANHDFDLDSNGSPIDENGEPVNHRVEAGVIAQEVLGVDELKFAVSPETKDEEGNVTTPYALNYNSLFTYAIAAIQEQQAMIEDLKKEIEQLKS